MMSGKTRVMATITADRSNPEMLRAMIDAGMQGVRINSAHAEPEGIDRMVATLRGIDPRQVVLMDTKGPELRTTELLRPLSLEIGQRIQIASGQERSTCNRLYINASAGFGDYMSVGSKLLLDDGEIELEVIGSTPDLITAKVVKSGILGSRKTLGIFEGELPPMPAVSPRDRRSIEAARELGIDIIAHSFVRSAHDVRQVRQIAGPDIKVFAKIECRPALERLEEIAGEADGLLVARGDLGSAVPLWQIPVWQYRIILEARRLGKPVIVSTQMLQSMIDSPTPTRAEVSDVATGVAQGADWLLLCGETATGKYPCEAISYMRRAADYSSENLPRWIP